MSTRIRAEITSKGKYYIPKHRYYELKHFCLQYPEWVKAYNGADGFAKAKLSKVSGGDVSDPTYKAGEIKAYYGALCGLVVKTCHDTDEVLAVYILKAVTENYSYEYLKMRMGIPCSKGTYYDRYRKFFYLLSKARK